MKNVESITDKEIQEIKDGVQKANKVKSIAMIITAFILFVVFITCTIVVLKWYALALLVTLTVINLLGNIISKKYAN